MNAMLKEILRWHNSVPHRHLAERWLGWARSLNGRYGHISQRHLGMSMTLVQTPALLYSCSQRWEQVAWNFSPQIKLALHPILQQTVWHTIDRPVMVQRMPNPNLPKYSGRHTTNQIPALRLQNANNPGQKKNTDNVKQLLKSGELDPNWSAPLRRVFSRINVKHLDDALIALRIHRRNVIADQSEKTVHWVLKKRQRVETRMTQQVMVIRRQPETSTVITQTEPELMAINSGWKSNPSVNSMYQSFAPQAIDIERLTDQVVRQIDQRIVAHRERMGRVF